MKKFKLKIIEFLLNFLDKIHFYLYENKMRTWFDNWTKKENSVVEMTEEESKQGHYLSVADFLRYIKEHNIPEDGAIYIRRIEDIYFNHHGWKVLKKEGESYHYLLNHNKDIDSGKYLDKDQYPNIKHEHLKKFSDKELNDSKDEFYPLFSCYSYDKQNVYLDAHY